MYTYADVRFDILGSIMEAVMIKGIIFDMDGVMIDTERSV